MANKNTYFEIFWGFCPSCNSDELRDIEETKTGKTILLCGNCGLYMIESDVKEKNEELEET